MKQSDFIAKAKLAVGCDTLYVAGCFGAPMTDYNKKRYSKNDIYNQAPNRQKLIQNATPDTFGFDCVCLIKGILWGWDAKDDMIYGGAAYKSNNVPDFTVSGMLDYCTEVSADFSNIQAGEVLWNPGHVGIYIGEGLAIECTSRWKDGVQITAVLNCGNHKNVMNSRTWQKHGKLQFIEYEEKKPELLIFVKQVKKGDSDNAVQLMQRLLRDQGYDGKNGKQLTIDGVFGDNTDYALREFQGDYTLTVDGICGVNTWSKLTECEVIKS